MKHAEGYYESCGKIEKGVFSYHQIIEKKGRKAEFIETNFLDPLTYNDSHFSLMLRIRTRILFFVLR